MILLILTLALFLFPAIAEAIPTHDTEDTVEVSSTDTATINGFVISCGGSPLLIAHVYHYTQAVTVSGVTTTAGAMTQLPNARVQVDVSGSGDWWVQDTWYRIGATGNQDITATLSSAATGITMVVRSYCNVNQSTPFGTAVAQADNSVDVTSASGELIIDSSWSYDQSQPVSAQNGQTERFNYTATYAVAAGGDKAGVDGANTIGWSAAINNTTMAVSLRTASGAAGSKRRSMLIVQ